MDTRMNELLAKARVNVLEPQVTALEEMLHSNTYGNSEGGTLGAYNKTPVQDELDGFLLDIKDGLVQHYEIEPDEALDYVFDTADELAANEELPAFPDDDAPDEDVVAWLNAAKSMGFAQYVADSAEEENGEVEEPGEAMESRNLPRK